MISTTLSNSTIVIIGSRSGLHNNLEISYDTANYSAIVLSDKQYYYGENISITLTEYILTSSGTQI